MGIAWGAAETGENRAEPRPPLPPGRRVTRLLSLDRPPVRSAPARRGFDPPYEPFTGAAASETNAAFSEPLRRVVVVVSSTHTYGGRRRVVGGLLHGCTVDSRSSVYGSPLAGEVHRPSARRCSRAAERLRRAGVALRQRQARGAKCFLAAVAIGLRTGKRGKVLARQSSK